MSSFNNLLSRTYLLSEAKGEKGEKNIKRNLPSPISTVFKSASEMAKLKGGIPTREGKKAAISYIKDYIDMKLEDGMDIEDERSLFRFTNIPAQGPLIDFLETAKPLGSDLTYAEILKDITDQDIETINKSRNREIEHVVSQSMVQRGDERQSQYDARAAAIALKRQEREEFKQMAQAANEKGNPELGDAMDSIGSRLEIAATELQKEVDIKTVQDSAAKVLDELEDEIDSAEGGEYSPKIYEALTNVRDIIENKITTVEQLQALINQISRLEGYQEIAYALSAAVKGIKSTRGGAVEDEEFDASKADLNNKHGVEKWEEILAKKRGFTTGEDEEHDWRPESLEEYEPDYDEVMGGEDEEHDWRPESTEEYPPYNEIENEEIINVVGYPHIVRYGSGGEVISVTTKEPGSKIDVSLVNKYLNSGFDLGRAIAAATSHPNDTNTGNEDAMMMGESYTSMYLTEQTKKDSIYHPKKEQNQSFKDRYKPKTSWQLEELRRYGM
jgi:hypothetical protein